MASDIILGNQDDGTTYTAKYSVLYLDPIQDFNSIANIEVGIYAKTPEEAFHQAMGYGRKVTLYYQPRKTDGFTTAILEQLIEEGTDKEINQIECIKKLNRGRGEESIRSIIRAFLPEGKFISKRFFSDRPEATNEYWELYNEVGEDDKGLKRHDKFIENFDEIKFKMKNLDLDGLKEYLDSY